MHACTVLHTHTYIYEVNLNNSKVDLVVKAARVIKNTYIYMENIRYVYLVYPWGVDVCPYFLPKVKRYKWYTCMVTITINISVLVGCHIIWLTRQQSRNFTHVAGDPGQSFCAKLMDGYSSHFSGLSRLLQICIYGPLLKASRRQSDILQGLAWELGYVANTLSIWIAYTIIPLWSVCKDLLHT